MLNECARNHLTEQDFLFPSIVDFNSVGCRFESCWDSHPFLLAGACCPIRSGCGTMIQIKMGAGLPLEEFAQ